MHHYYGNQVCVCVCVCVDECCVEVCNMCIRPAHRLSLYAFGLLLPSFAISACLGARRAPPPALLCPSYSPLVVTWIPRFLLFASTLISASVASGIESS